MHLGPKRIPGRFVHLRHGSNLCYLRAAYNKRRWRKPEHLPPGPRGKHSRVCLCQVSHHTPITLYIASYHQQCWFRQRRYINDMILGKIKPPAFASPACREPLPIGMTLYKRPVCLYRNNSENQSAVALFWIYSPNKTPEHISNMSAYLRGVVGIAHYPQPSVVESQLLIPRDVSSHWEHKSCVYQSSAAALRSIASSSRNRSTRFVISGLCGRGKGRNTLADLSHTVSHLLAIRAAVYSHVSQSHYAIIADEDVILPFDIDFDALIATAPHGFAMLRLTNFHEVRILQSTPLKGCPLLMHVCIHCCPQRFCWIGTSAAICATPPSSGATATWTSSTTTGPRRHTSLTGGR